MKPNWLYLTIIEDSDIRTMAGFPLLPLGNAMDSMTLWFNLVSTFMLQDQLAHGQSACRTKKCNQ